jgi:hypothetical protein
VFVKVPRLTDAEICSLYLDGDSAGMCGLKARVSHAHIVSILKACGVPIRSQSEAINLGNIKRRARAARKVA